MLSTDPVSDTSDEQAASLAGTGPAANHGPARSRSKCHLQKTPRRWG
jgi:hypothetical protein